MKWKLIGHDTFAREDYPLSEHESEEAAIEAARARLRSLEVTQPSATSGGQGDEGIQDRVFIERPDGTRYRVTDSVDRKLPFILLLAARDPAHGNKPDKDDEPTS